MVLLIFHSFRELAHRETLFAHVGWHFTRQHFNYTELLFTSLQILFNHELWGFSTGRCAVFAFHTFVGCTFVLAFATHNAPNCFHSCRFSVCDAFGNFAFDNVEQSFCFVSIFQLFFAEQSRRMWFTAIPTQWVLIKRQPEEAISKSATSEIADSPIACNAVQFHFDEEVVLTNLLGNEKKSTQA